MLLSPLYRVFKKVANPEKVFKKHFIAAALTGFVGAYTVSGAIVYDIAHTEWQSRDDFKITDVLSWNLITQHGKKGATAVGVSYVGDVGGVYGFAGLAYWRSRKRKALKANILNRPQSN